MNPTRTSVSMTNYLPKLKTIQKVQTTAQDYYVIQIWRSLSILFKYITLKTGELDSVMCIPPSKMDNILDYYHDKIICDRSILFKYITGYDQFHH